MCKQNTGCRTWALVPGSATCCAWSIFCKPSRCAGKQTVDSACLARCLPVTCRSFTVKPWRTGDQSDRCQRLAMGCASTLCGQGFRSEEKGVALSQRRGASSVTEKVRLPQLSATLPPKTGVPLQDQGGFSQVSVGQVACARSSTPHAGKACSRRTWPRSAISRRGLRSTVGVDGPGCPFGWELRLSSYDSGNI